MLSSVGSMSAPRAFNVRTIRSIRFDSFTLSSARPDNGSTLLGLQPVREWDFIYEAGIIDPPLNSLQVREGCSDVSAGSPACSWAPFKFSTLIFRPSAGILKNTGTGWVNANLLHGYWSREQAGMLL